MDRSAVLKIVSIHRGDYNVIESQFFYRPTHVSRFFRIQGIWFSFANGAEPAPARAGITQYQERGRIVFPTLPCIGTACLFADRMEIVPS